MKIGGWPFFEIRQCCIAQCMAVLHCHLRSSSFSFLLLSLHHLQPERLKGVAYSVQSDIWSLGVSLVEMALGMFPYPPPTPERIEEALLLPAAGSEGSMGVVSRDEEGMAIFELLEYIVNAVSGHFLLLRALLGLCMIPCGWVGVRHRFLRSILSISRAPQWGERVTSRRLCEFRGDSLPLSVRLQHR